MRSALACAFVAIVAGRGALAAPKVEPPAKPKDIAAEINKPRVDAREIAFDTDEGTWMSVDVSPDGKTLVFDLLGDIYALPIEGGAATAITSGPAYDSQPRFSPDGASIAFASDRGGIENVWLMDRDGKNPRALSSEKDAYVRGPAFTPDGQYVLARKEDGKRAGIPPVELWLYHREGGSGVKLTNGDDVNNIAGPVASRDGRFIYFAARRVAFNYVPDLSNGLWQIVRYDRRTGDSHPITNGVGGGARPVLSPSGDMLLYVSRRDAESVLVARDLALGSERILARGLTRDEQEGFAQLDVWPGYAFTPDGKSVVLSSNGKIRRLDVASGQLTTIPFLAHVKQSVAPRVTWQEKVDSSPLKARILRNFSLSPDGRALAFDALGQIWVQDLDQAKPKGSPRRLTSSPPTAREYAPAFSPDGRFIAYVSWSDSTGGHVWRVPATGGTPEKLTRTAGHYANPSWSPKGDRIAVLRGSGLEFRGRQPEQEDYFEAHWLDATGGDLHYVAAVNGPAGARFHPRATWSSDGERLYFAEPQIPQKRTDDPKNDLVSVRLDGSDKKRHVRLQTSGELVPSPDGAWVAFTSRDNVYVAALPATASKDPAEVGLKDGALPVFRVSEPAGGYLGWTDGARTLTWGFANTFNRIALADVFKFAADERAKAEVEKAAGDAKSGDAKKKDAPTTPAKDDDALKIAKATTIEIALVTPRSTPSGSFVLRHARVITMKGDAVIDNADVVVTANRIAAVGPAGTVAVPAGAREIDASGKTVIPGLIDTHAHLHYSGLEIFPDSKWEYAANLAYGVTTTYDPSAPSQDVFSQGEMIEAGVMTGPRVYSSGDILYGGQQTDAWAEVEGLADATRQIRRMKGYGARMVKIYQQPRRSQRMYFAEASRKEKMLLTAEGGGELHTDITMVLDGYTAFEHSLPVPLYKDVIELLARSGTHYTPTLLVSYGGPWGELYYYQTRNPHDDAKLRRFVPHPMLDGLGRRHPWTTPEEYHFPTVAQGVAAVARAGGNVSLGAHGQLQGLGVHWELWAMAGDGGSPSRTGMKPLDALRAATLFAADKLGLAPDLGSVEVGKLADLVVLDQDPLADIHNTNSVRWVVKNGEVYEGDSLKRVWPDERPAPSFFWQTAE